MEISSTSKRSTALPGTPRAENKRRRLHRRDQAECWLLMGETLPAPVGARGRRSPAIGQFRAQRGRTPRCALPLSYLRSRRGPGEGG